MIHKIYPDDSSKWLFSEAGENLSSVLAWLIVVDIEFLYWMPHLDDHVQVTL